MPTSEQLLTLNTRIAPAAFAGAMRTGIPAEVLCAQAILESGWLRHVPGNNCFGIKSYLGEYGRQFLRTLEWFDPVQLKRFLAQHEGRTATPATPTEAHAGRTLYEVQDWFATFATLADCFTRRALLFTEGRYAPIAKAYRESANLEAFVRAFAPIYATDPEYGDKVLALAESKEVAGIIDQLYRSIRSFE